MGLLQVAERLSLSFFASGANVARTEAALAAARDLYGQPIPPSVVTGERRATDAPSAAVIESRDMAPAREALSA